MSVADLLPGGKVEPKRHHDGRYLIVPADGGPERPYSRATTIAETVDDRHNLEKWMQRQVALGLALRPDLLAAVAGALPDANTKEGRKRLNALCDQASEAVAAKGRATLGSELHRLTERYDRGEDGYLVLDALRADLEAYKAATAGCRFDHVETILVCEAIGSAGTADRLGPIPGLSGIVVSDLKTGSDLSWSWLAISQQLAIYANAETIYDPATCTHQPNPVTNREHGVIWHLPAGEATCTVYVVDLVRGWEMARVSKAVRKARTRARELAQPYVLPGALPLEIPAGAVARPVEAVVPPVDLLPPAAPAAPVVVPAPVAPPVSGATAPSADDDAETARITHVLELVHDLCIAGAYPGPDDVLEAIGFAGDLDDVAGLHLAELEHLHARWAGDEPLHDEIRAWFRARIEHLGSQQKDQQTADVVIGTIKGAWPAGAPMPKPDAVYTDEQAAAVDLLLTQAETATSGAWVNDPRKARAALRERLAVRAARVVQQQVVLEPPWPTVDVDVLARLIERLQALPDDVAADLVAKGKAGPDPIPHLRARPHEVTQAHLDRLEQLLAEAEPVAEQRRLTALSLADTLGAPEHVVAAAVTRGKSDRLSRLTPPALERLRSLASAAADQLVAWDGQRLTTTGRAAPVLLERAGSEPAAVTRAGRAWPDLNDQERAGLPRTWPGVCGDPVLAATAARS